MHLLKIILSLCALTGLTLPAQAVTPVVSAAPAPSSLEGVWVATTAENGALEGTIILGPKQVLTLRANGQPEFLGTWAKAPANKLKLEIPEAGVSVVGYSLKGNRLALTYDNGSTQVFARQVGGKAAPAPKPRPTPTPTQRTQKEQLP